MTQSLVVGISGNNETREELERRQKDKTEELTDQEEDQLNVIKTAELRAKRARATRFLIPPSQHETIAMLDLAVLRFKTPFLFGQPLNIVNRK